MLSDRSVYRNFFRTVPSDELQVSAVFAIMESYGWRQLSVFTEEQPQFLQVRVYSLCILCLLHCLLFYDCVYQLYQRLKNMQMSSPNITRVKSYCFGKQQLQNYTSYADNLAFVFVSGNYQVSTFFPYCRHNNITVLSRMKNHTSIS